MFKFIASLAGNRAIRSQASGPRISASANVGNRRNARRMNAMLDSIGRIEDRG